MSALPDSFWLVSAVSFVSATLLIVMDVAGLVLALRYRHVAKASALLAAAGFGIALVTTAGGIAVEVTDMGWTLSSPYSSTVEPSVWPLIAMSAASFLGTCVSAALLLAALRSAWRRLAGVDAPAASAADEC